MWAALTLSQQRTTLHAMSRFGGGFVSRLAEAWKRADYHNGNRLGAAFPDILKAYGPGSDAYRDAERMEAA